MSTTKPSPRSLIRNLSPGLFWDVNGADLDPDQHAEWLVPRVVERGSRSDVDAIFNYYDETTIRGALTGARSLDRKSIAYFAARFNLRRDDFRAYRQRPVCWQT